MLVRCCLMFLFIQMINGVSPNVIVKKSVGKSAILPCSYTEDKNKVNTVFWRQNDTTNVFEFSPSNKSSGKGINRAESFPQEYDKGNYSIKIKQLETTDAGEYTCFITPVHVYENVLLIIESKSLYQKYCNTSNVDQIREQFIGDQDDKQRPEIIIVVIVICVVICVVISFLLILRHKRMWIFKTR